MKQIQILYVITKLELGGAQKVCLSLLKNIKSNGYPTSLISGTEGKLVSQAKSHDSIFLLKNFKREVKIKSIFLELSAFYSMISRMRKIKKQFPGIIVHTHSTKAGLMGRWAAFFARIKKRVHTVHGFGFHEHQSKMGWTLNFVLEYLTSLITSHYVCVSLVDRNIGKKYLPRFWKKSSIIRAAIEDHKFVPNQFVPSTLVPAKTCKLENHFTFGTVSCLKPQKNIIDLLKAFNFMYKNLSQNMQDLVHLQIIGDGNQKILVEDFLTDHDLSHKVDLLGWQADVAKWMKSWDAFVMSSLWEGLPCAIIEARFSKLPVIAYKISGIPEVIKNKKNGFLVKPGNWRQLAIHMQKLVEDKKLYAKLSTHSQDLSDFSNDSMIKKHIKLYKKLSR